MNTRNFKSKTALAATLCLGLGVEGKAQQKPEGTFGDVRQLGADVNSPFLDAVGIVSGDGLTLVFTSDRPGGSGDADIYIADRDDVRDAAGDLLPFTEVRNISELNTDGIEFATFLSDDGLTLYYMSTPPGGQADIYVAQRASRNASFQAPQALDGINTTEFFEGGLTLTADGLEAYFISIRPGGKGGRDIWAARRASVDGPFSEVWNVAEANTALDETVPSISADGLTLFWSDFPGDEVRSGGNGGADIWCASRESRGRLEEPPERFGEPVNLGSPINTVTSDYWIHVSTRWPDDGSLVYFNRCLDENCYDTDIYQASWRVPEPLPPPRFLRGDCNGDGAVSGLVTDAVFMLNFSFLGGPAPSCVAACDADADGVFSGTVTDAVYLLNFNFLGGSPPAAPFPQCARSSLQSDAALGCTVPPEECSGQ